MGPPPNELPLYGEEEYIVPSKDLAGSVAPI